jgi:iron complex transport system ATP-binding protein
MALTARNIDVEIGGKRLVSAAALKLVPGELCVIVGPNGAGKSTLMKALCGEQPISSGQVLLEEQDIRAWNPNRRARIRAVLPQHSTLTFPFTVREVAELGRAPYRSCHALREDRMAVDQAMQLADVAHLQSRFFPDLSGGEAQRVQLARVLAQIDNLTGDARYLFLDEPTSSLDPAHQHATLKLARELSRDNVAVLAVLHDLNLAALYADRIIVMQEGRVVADGGPSQVLTEGIISRVFKLSVEVMKHPTLDRPLIIQGQA